MHPEAIYSCSNGSNYKGRFQLFYNFVKQKIIEHAVELLEAAFGKPAPPETKARLKR